jgi:hypothetical protein
MKSGLFGVSMIFATVRLICTGWFGDGGDSWKFAARSFDFGEYTSAQDI